MAIKLLNPKQSQPSGGFNFVNNFVNDLKQAGSALGQKLQYFNPSSNGGDNFWSAPAVQQVKSAGKQLVNSGLIGIGPSTPFNAVGAPTPVQKKIMDFRPNPRNSLTLGQGIAQLPALAQKQWGEGQITQGLPGQKILKPLVKYGPGAYMKTFAKGLSTIDAQKQDPFVQAGNVIGVAGALNPASTFNNILGGPIGSAFKAGENVLTRQPVTQGLGDAYQEGMEFSFKLGPIGEMAGKILSPVLSKLSPVEIQNVNRYINIWKSAPTKEIKDRAWSLLWKRVGQNVLKSTIEGSAGMALYGATMPAKDKEERLKNILDQGIMGAAFSGLTRVGGLATGAIVRQGRGLLRRSSEIPLGLSTRAISKEEHYKNLATQQKGEADLGGGKKIPTVKVGELNIEEPVARAVSVTAGEKSGSSGFHRKFSQEFNGLSPSWAIVYKEKPSPELISAAEKAGLSVNVRKNGITDVYLPKVLRGEPKKAQAIFDRFAENYQSTKIDQTLNNAGLSGNQYPLLSDQQALRPIAEEAYQATAKNGEVTISSKGNKPTDGFAYAPFKGTEEAVPVGKVSAQTYLDYMSKHKDKLAIEGNYLGTWENEGKIYFDISKVGNPSASVLEEAMRGSQLAVFDLKNFKEISLGTLDKEGRGIYTKLDEASNIFNRYQRENSAGSGTGEHGGVPEVLQGQSPTGDGGIATSIPNSPPVDVNQLRRDNLQLINQKAPGESVDAFLKRNPKIAEQFNLNKNKMAEANYGRQRGFLEQVQTSANSPDFVKAAVATLPQEYRQIANEPTWEDAIRTVYAKPDMVRDKLLNTNEWSKEPGKRPALFISLAQKYFKEGNEKLGLEMIDEGAKEATLNGQNTQAWAMWSNMTPVGMVNLVKDKLSNYGEKQTQIGKLGQKVGQSILHKMGIKTKATGDVVRDLSSTVSEEFNKINQKSVDVIAKEAEQFVQGNVKETPPTGTRVGQKISPQRKLASRIKAAITSTEPKDSPVKDMVNTLFAIAKETLPPKASNPRDSMSLIVRALENKEQYKSVWEKAKVVLEKKYASDPEALASLEPYFNQAIGERTFATGQANKVMSEEMKKLGVDIGQIVKEHYTTVESTKVDLSQKIVERTGLSEEKVKPLVDYITKRFEDLTSAKKQQLLDRAFAEKKVAVPKDTPAEKASYLKEIIKLSNLGAFSEEKYLDPLAKKLGLPTLTPEMAKEIYTKMENIQMEKDPTKKLKKITEVFDSINEMTPPGFWETIDVMRYNGMLSGFKPQLRNIFGNSFALLPLRTAILTQEVTNDWVMATLHGKERTRYYKEVPAYLKGFINAIPDATTAWMDGWKGIARNENPDLRSLRLRQFPKKITFASNMLEAFDRAFTTLGTSGETSALEVRGITGEKATSLAKNTTEQMIYRNKLDPKNKTGQGHLLAGWDKTIEAVQKLANDVPIIKWVVPFIRISGMTSKEAMQYTPPVSELTKVGSEGWKRDQIKAKNMIGYGMTAVGFMLALQGRTTWAAPTDPTKRKIFYDTGRVPFAIKIGDNWVPMQLFGPLIFTLGIPAAMKYYASEDPETSTKIGVDKWTSVLQGTIAGQLQLFSAQSFLSSFNTLVKIANQDKDVDMGTFLAQTASTVNPWDGALRSIAQVLDPTYRKSKGVIDTLFKDLPGFSQLVPAYETSEGTPSKRRPINSILPYDIGKENLKFEPLYDMKTSQLQQNAIEKDAQTRAGDFIKSAPQMTSEERLLQLQTMAKDDPAVYQEVVKQLQPKKPSKSVMSGSIYATKPGQEAGRARYIFQTIQNMPVVKREDFFNQMIQQGVLTPKVQDELMKQLQPSTTNTYGESTIDRIKRLLVPNAGAADYISGASIQNNAPPTTDTTSNVGNGGSTVASSGTTKTTSTTKITVRKGKKKSYKKLIAAAGKVPKRVKIRKTFKSRLKLPKRPAIKKTAQLNISSSRKAPRISQLSVKFPTLSGSSLRPKFRSSSGTTRKIKVRRNG